MNVTPIGGVALMADLASYATTTVTIKSCADSTQDAYNAPVAVYTPRAEATNIPAIVTSVDVGQRVRPQETRTADVTKVDTWKRVMLFGPYPSITLKDRCTWNSFDWNILSLRPDPESTYLEMLIEQVVPGNV